MKIAIYGKAIEKEHQAEINTLFRYLDQKEINYLIHEDLFPSLKKWKILDCDLPPSFNSHEGLSNEIDFLLSLGGDGTLLDTILLVRDLDIPILGINTGRLGFLSLTPTSEIEAAIDALIEGNFIREERSLLRLDSNGKLFGDNNHALNEISIMKRDTSSMIIIHTELDGKHLNSYWTDGLIISTATGSTAYSLSCGGPIIMPGSGNFVITPIAPHNLNVRPIVIDDHSVLTIRVESRAKKNLVALDSRSTNLKNDELLTIQKADYKICLVQLDDNSFIHSLRSKLNWGLDKRNK